MFLCVFLFVLLPWPLRWSRVRHHAADGETGLKDSIVLNSETLAFLAAIDQWTEVDVTRRCDLVPKEGPQSNSQLALDRFSELPPINKLMMLADCDEMASDTF